jgi:hypothetical protein
LKGLLESITGIALLWEKLDQTRISHFLQHNPNNYLGIAVLLQSKPITIFLFETESDNLVLAKYFQLAINDIRKYFFV